MGGFFKGDFGQFFTPRELIAFCVQMLDPGPDDVILDPFLGSGTTAIAALQNNRRAIGIEVDEKYCQLAVERLKKERLV
jgi:type I restriction enzyme M protein